MPRLLRVILTRLVHAVLLLLAVIVVSFSLLSAAPGDAAEVINNLSGGGDEEFIEQIRQDRGLDRPFIVQLADYTAGVFTGDLDDSYQYQTPVSEFDINRLWPTLLLTGSALFIAIVGGTVLGIYAAQRPTKLSSHLVTGEQRVAAVDPPFVQDRVVVLLDDFPEHLGASVPHRRLDGEHSGPRRPVVAREELEGEHLGEVLPRLPHRHPLGEPLLLDAGRRRHRLEALEPADVVELEDVRPPVKL